MLFRSTVLSDIKHWRKLATDELEEALSYRFITNRAKNVIIFVGDGMSSDTITASRIFRAGETSRLAWESFPHIGILKVYITPMILIYSVYGRYCIDYIMHVEKSSINT